jgi:hypothetical protein
MKELNLPPNASQDMKEFFKTMRASIEESSKKARGQVFISEGVIIWEEPLEEYEQRMKELNK